MSTSGKSKSTKGLKDPYAVIRCSNSSMCTSYLYSPIFTCISEHNVCTTCVSFYQLKCPICSNALTFTTIKVDLENISKKLLNACKFRNRGCHYQFPQSEVALHEEICTYAKKSCFSTKCGWSGNLGDLIEHMEASHNERVYTEPEITFYTRKINSRKAGVDQISFVTCELGSFWVRFQFSEDEEQFYGAVQYIGPKQKAEKMECQFEMQERDEEGELTGLKCVYTGKIYTENDSFDDIFNNEEAFSVCLDFAKYFEYDDVLRVFLKIRKAC